MKDSKIIVTIFGADKIGIVAAISQVMEKYEVNITFVYHPLLPQDCLFNEDIDTPAVHFLDL